MNRFTPFPKVPNTMLTPVGPTATVTTTTTKIITKTVRAASYTTTAAIMKPYDSADLVRNAATMLEQAARNGGLAAPPGFLGQAIQIIMCASIVGGTMKAAYQQLDQLPAPHNETARRWEGKVKRAYIWLKRRVTSDENLRNEIAKVHEEWEAAKEEARLARDDLEDQQKLLNDFDELKSELVRANKESFDFEMESLYARQDARVLREELAQSPNSLRQDIRHLKHRLHLHRAGHNYIELKGELEQAHQHADEVQFQLEREEARFSEALQKISKLAQEKATEVAKKDEALQLVQEQLSQQQAATVDANERADELQSQFVALKEKLQLAQSEASQLQERLAEQNQVLTQAKDLAEDRKKELGQANELLKAQQDLERDQAELITADTDRLNKLEQQLKDERGQRKRVDAEIKLLKARQKLTFNEVKVVHETSPKAISITPQARALTNAWESRNQKGSPVLTVFAPYPSSITKEVAHTKIKAMDASSHFSTPSKKRAHVDDDDEEESTAPVEIQSSPPQAAKSHPDDVEDDLMDIDDVVPSQQPASKMKLGAIPDLKPPSSMPVPPPATPAPKTSRLRSPSGRMTGRQLTQETPSWKSSRNANKRVDYKESARSTRFGFEPSARIDEKGTPDTLQGHMESELPSKPASKKPRTTKTPSPKKPDMLKDVQKSRVKKPSASTTIAWRQRRETIRIGALCSRSRT
ncbi:hypothetical protein EK21DRAFT_110754 [Setomelanomma holmii]|uniref:Uncharacterized protein n=1 Tax=Setomelanomma holmii TaxID=210430 RepID=A0A9P4HE27_9PLEO|nr:hypothetical protein EK21DRAFT_110754 [Setomelanomma holmii]